jgi:glycosyltransferase involved in cell wall biosynthesis
LDSIICQKYERWECILVDDGSKDSSGVICDEYSNKDSRFRVIHKINGGVSSARNVGLQEAKGEWITFCDSDDEFFPETLETYSSYFQRCDAIKAGYVEYYASGRKKKYSIENDIICNEKENILKTIDNTHYWGFLWNFCVRASIAQKYTFDCEINWCEDHLFVLECLSDCICVLFSNAIVYKYYVNDIDKDGEGINLSKKTKEPRLIEKLAIKEKKIRNSFVKSDLMLLDYNDNLFYARIEYAIFNAFLRCEYAHINNLICSYMSKRKLRVLWVFCRYIKRKWLHIWVSLMSTKLF